MTLLELVLAMGMTVMLAASLYSALYTAFKARSSALDRVKPVRAASAAMELIGKDFSGALPPTGILAGAFQGQAGSEVALGNQELPMLEFYTVANDSYVNDIRNGGVWRIELAVQAMEDGRKALVRRATPPVGLLAQEEPAPQKEVLCRGIKSVQLQYLQDDQWLDEWDSTAVDNTLPAAVEVTLELGLGEGQDVSERTYRMTRTFVLPMSVSSSTDSADAGTTSEE